MLYSDRYYLFFVVYEQSFDNIDYSHRLFMQPKYHFMNLNFLAILYGYDQLIIRWIYMILDAVKLTSFLKSSYLLNYKQVWILTYTWL